VWSGCRHRRRRAAIGFRVIRSWYMTTWYQIPLVSCPIPWLLLQDSLGSPITASRWPSWMPARLGGAAGGGGGAPIGCYPWSPSATVGAGDTPAVARSRTHQCPPGRLGETARRGSGSAAAGSNTRPPGAEAAARVAPASGGGSSSARGGVWPPHASPCTTVVREEDDGEC
jgi:hypothetical protein